jgi:hypothetical protein
VYHSGTHPSPNHMRAGAAVSDDQPALNTIAEMTAVSVARGTLDAREHMLARLAALVAVGRMCCISSRPPRSG